MLRFLVAFASLFQHPPIETFSGTLEPRWWMEPPMYGESPEDGAVSVLTLRLDEPRGAVRYVAYTPNGTDNQLPDAAAMACVGGHATVTGAFTRVGWWQVPAILDHAAIVSCTPPTPFEPPFGETVTLTGTLRRWWWYLAPGFGKNPGVDKSLFGVVLLVDGRPVPLFTHDGEGALERHRRVLAACDGQEVTVTGRWEPSKYPESKPNYKLRDVTYDTPCADPRLDRPAGLGDKRMPKEWLEGG